MTPEDTNAHAAEQRLRTALHERATHAVPDARPVPPIDWPSATRRVRPGATGRPRWRVPLAAAAAVLLIAVALVAQQARRVDTGPGIGVATASQSGIVTGPGPSGATSPTPGWGSVTLTRGGTVPLPVSWVGRPSPLRWPGATEAHCFGPSPDNPCVIVVAALDPVPGLDPELDWASVTREQRCPGQEPGSMRTVSAGPAQVGGRDGEFRRITWTCPGAPTTGTVGLYVVPTVPAYLLATQQPDDPAVAAVLARMLAGALLPPQSAPLRLADQGTVQSVTTTGDGYDVRILRTRGYLNEAVGTGTAVTYHLPARLVDRRALATGSPLKIRTDGTTVTEVIVLGG